MRAARVSDRIDSVSLSRILKASLASSSACRYSVCRSSHPSSLDSEILKSWNISVCSSGILLVSVRLQSSGVKMWSR